MYDIIIVGGGTAGCVLASRLSENPDINILLIEQGSSYNSLLSSPLLCQGLNIGSIWHEYPYKTIKQPGLKNRIIACPQGKVLGGSSSINAMIYNRGHRACYDSWAKQGLTDWAYQDMLNYFKKSEHFLHTNDNYHGYNGFINTQISQSSHPFADAFIASCIENGFVFNNDFNGETQEGVGYLQAMMHNGLRSCPANTYIKSSQKRTNLHIISKAKVTKIIFSGDKATGIEYLKKQCLYRAEASKQIIMSAGTFHTPQILMLSGIGDEHELKKHGIKLLNHLPQVGQHLRDHLIVRITYNSSYNNLSIKHSLKEIYRYLRYKKGIFSTNFHEVAAYHKSEKTLLFPDILLYGIYAASISQPRDVLFQLSAVNPQSYGKVALKK